MGYVLDNVGAWYCMSSSLHIPRVNIKRVVSQEDATYSFFIGYAVYQTNENVCMYLRMLFLIVVIKAF